MQTELFLVRHGQPKITEAMLGRTDVSLSNFGWQQLGNSVRRLTDIDLIVSSPLLRCSEFAQHFAQKTNKELLINSGFQECNFGDWDGKKYQELHEKYPEHMENFFSKPNQYRPPNGEALSEFNHRVVMSFDQLIEQHAGKRIILLSHAGVIRTIVAWCLDMDFTQGNQFKSFSIDYASISHLSVFHAQDNFSQIQYLNWLPSLRFANEQGFDHEKPK